MLCPKQNTLPFAYYWFNPGKKLREKKDIDKLFNSTSRMYYKDGKKSILPGKFAPVIHITEHLPIFKRLKQIYK